MSAIKYVLTSFIVVIASFVTTIQAVPNDDSATKLLHKADSLYRMGSFERAAEIYLLAMLIILAKAFRATILLQPCGLSVLQNRILLKHNTILRIAI